jgi:threonine/homoserine/homoserine lactone efflux protein
VIFIAFIIGFLGYLPPGNINLTAVQLGLNDSKKMLWLFIAFAAVMEFGYCLGSLFFIEVLLQNPGLIISLKWAAVFVFSALGILSLLHKPSEKPHKYSGIKRGIFVAIVNPLQIPFWLIWGAYVLQNKWVENTLPSMMIFSFFTSIGTIAILMLYGIGGQRIIGQWNINRILLNRIIGLLLIGLAVYQLVMLLVE